MLGKTLQPLAALVFCTTVLFAVPSEAQLPWPDAPKQQSSAPWPTAPSRSNATPAAASPAPMMGMPGAAPMTPVPQAGGRGGAGAGAPPCMAEFTRLQRETDKFGDAAKAASKRKAPREEMCKRLTSFAAAIGKWASYTAKNADSCGIPSRIVKQLKAGAQNIAKSKQQVCATGLGGGPSRAPTLSDALGQTVMPTPEAKTRPSVITGTLDTLTGVPIGR